MKFIFILLLSSSYIWARPVVLLSYFDTFGSARFNNSEVVANLLFEKTKEHPDFELKLCKVRTIFDKSFYELENCLSSLPEAPAMVLGLGESNCNLKIEAMGRNLDHTFGPDNEGNERSNRPIIPQGSYAIGLNYPLPEMYCSLREQDRKALEVSNNAGSFVCNNYAYQIAYKYPDLNFGFIHVPAHNCRNLETKTEFSVKVLETMISAGVKVKQFSKLPTQKSELKVLRKNFADTCRGEYFEKLRGVDERKIWPF